MLRKGDWVWVDSNIGVPIGARVKDAGSRQYLLVDDEGKEQVLLAEHSSSARPMHDTSVGGVDDMIQLGDLSEAGLLRNLLVRHKRGLIYTYTGSVLVAVNPYKELPIYTEDQVKMYQGRKLGDLPPHVFAIADSCYYNLTRSKTDQCCIISGESGAGKTESSKLLLQYLAAISGQKSAIEQQILESNPILEAFGNAKTIRNDNSSRFGKYLEIFFNKDGVIEGARVEQYLLEKCRVCHQAAKERNYHIFYCMLAGLTVEQRRTLCLGEATAYQFLTKGGCIVCDGRDDAKDFAHIVSAFKVLTFRESQCSDIYKLLAAILHLGNISFEGTSQNNMDSSNVSTSANFNMAYTLLEVEKDTLACSLTQRSFLTNRETVTKPLDTTQAFDCRDAFVKAIYNKMFLWIVGKINSVIGKAVKNNSGFSRRSIGLLDIFGFENFHINSFEQLCINLANEELQHFFVLNIFELEQQEYNRQGVVWNNISFENNQQTLDLLVGKPCNLLALIDEESNFPKGTDSTMLQKMNKHHKEHSDYISPKNEHESRFGIQHFAGVVFYDSNGFLEKNRDAVSSNVIRMISTSKNKLLQEIFYSELSTNGVRNPSNSKVTMTPKSTLRAVGDTRKQIVTLSGQFRQSLDSLMKALSVCYPFFIRCFKPNTDKNSERFDRELCMVQLRYSGMMDTVRIRKLGFPIRYTFSDFLFRYRVLLNTASCDPKKEPAEVCCDAICKLLIGGRDQWKLGKSKIFLKDAHDSLLERARDRGLAKTVLIIQKVMLGVHDRKSFLKKKKAVRILQRNWRAYKKREHDKKLRHGYARLAARIRSRRLHHLYKKQRTAVVVLQTQVRGYLARKNWKRHKEEASNAAREQEILARALEQETLAQAAIELQKLADVIAQSERASDESETSSEDEDQRAAPEGRNVKVVEVEHNPLRNIVVTSDSETEDDLPKTPASASPAPASPTPDSPGKRSLPEEEQKKEKEEEEKKEEKKEEEKKEEEKKEEEEDDYFDDGTDEFSFQKFSSLHFQGNASHTHIYQRLKQPLLAHQDERDALVCPTVWWIILRFMGDIAEPRAPDPNNPQRRRSSAAVNHPSMVHRPGRRLSSLVGLDQKILRKNKKKYGGGNRRGSTIPEEPEDFTDEDIFVGEGPALDRPLTPLEKLHIIVGYGLSRPGIRDEIFCQILKQLTDNKDKKVCLRGWVLLSMCLSSFPPSQILIKYLESFLRKGPSGYGAFCAERLRRTVANGERSEVPCWIELQATESQKPMDVTVALMDGRTFTLLVDSACTSGEILRDIAEKINLTDTYGFSLYISIYEKRWTLGSSGKYIMDSISQCEQEVRRQGMEEGNAPWKLSIRKEMFTPWHDCSEDAVSTELIYRQVLLGLKSEEYVCIKEDDYALLAARHYFIQFGLDNNKQNTRKVVEECITNSLIDTKSLAKWNQLVDSIHSQGGYRIKDVAKAEIIDYARQHWSLFFSKFYDVTMLSGLPLPLSRFTLAINWSGVLFMDGRDKKLLEIPYVELSAANLTSESRPTGGCVKLTTFQEEFVLRCGEAEEAVQMIQNNLEGLRQHSQYAVAMQDLGKQDDPSILVCKRGDLLVVQKDRDFSATRRWNVATNDITGITGNVQMNNIQFLSTLSKPSEAILSLLSPTSNQRKAPTGQGSTQQRQEVVAPISIKEFALEHFGTRLPDKDVNRVGASRVAVRERLWVSSKEPLKQPLLRRLVNDSEMHAFACSAFIAILKYMGDYPIKQVRSQVELTDQIFGPATQHLALQDEIYCQIMRQMTNNRNRVSMDRGWQLMWLCTGLFPPSQALARHAHRFLLSRPCDQLAPDCLRRFQAILSGEPRQYPPHYMEVDAIQQNSTQIFHRIHFPNETEALFEVTSMTKIRDLCSTIASELNLSSLDGYSLFMKTPYKVISLADEMCLFDSLRQNADPPKKVKKVKEAPLSIFLVFFMRKLWFNVIPGRDLTADLTFHFPQEMPKYLRGYHSFSREDMIALAALLFRIQTDSDRSQFVMIPKMLKQLVPEDQMEAMSTDEWKKHIILAYNKQVGITADEAKVKFLKLIVSSPMFGCSFFEVKQTCESSYPTNMRIVISKLGVSFIDPKTKEQLVMHLFNRILDWQSSNNQFHMTIGGLVKGYFACETPLAFKMEDLLTSYISMYEKEREAFLPRNQMRRAQTSNNVA